MKRIQAFALVVWAFVVGDDWHTAIGVAVTGLVLGLRNAERLHASAHVVTVGFQTCAVVLAVVWALGFTFAMLWLIDRITPVRVGAEAEITDTVPINRRVRRDHERLKERGQRHGLGRGVAGAVARLSAAVDEAKAVIADRLQPRTGF